ncbi:MAG: DNA-directed RNA polymerase subunit alpha [Gemmatimonadota bacterium]|nr:MAG: DNA-directed RNA polymerase subunit alpha [Gemmatimonadota bacterium]
MQIDLRGWVLPERVEVTETSDDGRWAEFVVQPLERGYGQTLGNATRRILLSSLPGWAIWSFRASGVVHEHQTIGGVVEDVHEIIQRFKGLVFRVVSGEDEAKLELVVREPGVITARHITANPKVDIINRDHQLFTLQEELPEDRPLRIELWIDRGRGFVLADQHERHKDDPVDLILIDSIYSPVLRANFKVDETRVGQRTDFDRLTLTVETNGAMRPEEAVAYSAELMAKHLEYLRRFAAGNGETAAPEMELVPVSEKVRDLVDRPLEEFDISVRSRHTLEKGNIHTLGDIARRSEDEILQIENFGRKSLQEVEDLLRAHGLRFGMSFREGEDGELYVVSEGSEGGNE